MKQKFNTYEELLDNVKPGALLEVEFDDGWRSELSDRNLMALVKELTNEFGGVSIKCLLFRDSITEPFSFDEDPFKFGWYRIYRINHESFC